MRYGMYKYIFIYNHTLICILQIYDNAYIYMIIYLHVLCITCSFFFKEFACCKQKDLHFLKNIKLLRTWVPVIYGLDDLWVVWIASGNFKFPDLSQPSRVKQLTSWEWSHIQNQSALLNDFPNFPIRPGICFLISLEDTHQPMILGTFQPPQKTTPCHTLRPSRPAPTTFQKRPGLGSFESDDFSKRLAEGSTKLWGRGLFLGTWRTVKQRRFAHLQVESNSIWWNLMNKTLKTYPNAQWGWPIYLHLGSW